MRIKATLGKFNATWAVVVDRVRGGFDRDAFAGINLGTNARGIDAGSMIVTGTPGDAGIERLELHIATAGPDGAAVPVRLDAQRNETPVDFLERVERYVKIEPALRLLMARHDILPAHPERVTDIDNELALFAEHVKRHRPRPECTVAPTWEAARAERTELVRRHTARAALDYTLAITMRETGQSRQAKLAALLARGSEENIAGDLSAETRKDLITLLGPPGQAEPVAERPPRRRHETAPASCAAVEEPELAGGHPNVRLRHPAATWAKVLRVIDPYKGNGGYAFDGPFLRHRSQNDVPICSILISGHEVGSRRYPQSERMASLVCIDPDGHPLRVPMSSDANRTDLDFRDYVADYLQMPAIERAKTLLSALWSGEPGPHTAIKTRPDRERLLVTQYINAIQHSIGVLEKAGITGARPGDVAPPEFAGTAVTAAQ